MYSVITFRIANDDLIFDAVGFVVGIVFFIIAPPYVRMMDRLRLLWFGSVNSYTIFVRVMSVLIIIGTGVALMFGEFERLSHWLGRMSATR
jgi:ABC-type uncharacterized transport system permease subunit